MANVVDFTPNIIQDKLIDNNFTQLIDIVNQMREEIDRLEAQNADLRALVQSSQSTEA